MGKFTSDLKGFKRKALENVERVRRESIIKLFDMVAVASPVDTGRFRGNWQCSVGTPNISTIESVRPLSQVQKEIQANLGELKDTVFLTNNLPYAEPLEYDGHSAQAPEGMVRVNAAKWPDIVKSVAKSIK